MAHVSRRKRKRSTSEHAQSASDDLFSGARATVTYMTASRINISATSAKYAIYRPSYLSASNDTSVDNVSDVDAHRPPNFHIYFDEIYTSPTLTQCIRYDTMRYIYMRSKAGDMASLV